MINFLFELFLLYSNIFCYFTFVVPFVFILGISVFCYSIMYKDFLVDDALTIFSAFYELSIFYNFLLYGSYVHFDCKEDYKKNMVFPKADHTVIFFFWTGWKDFMKLAIFLDKKAMYIEFDSDKKIPWMLNFFIIRSNPALKKINSSESVAHIFIIFDEKNSKIPSIENKFHYYEVNYPVIFLKAID